MDTKEILRKVKEFYDKEYDDLEKILEDIPHWATAETLTNCAIDRCLGVAFFAQNLGCSFKDVDGLYDEIRTDLLMLLEEYNERKRDI